MADKDPTIWMAQLQDSSVKVAFVNSDLITVKDELKRKIDPEEIVCLWPSGEPQRMASSSEFKTDSTLLIYPSYRIQAADFEIGEQKFSWDLKSSKVSAPKLYIDSPARNEGPQPPSEFVYGSDDLRPTIWLKRPEAADARLGRITMNDGRQLLFGEGQASLKSVDQLYVTLVLGNETAKIRVREIASVIFPKPN